MLITKPFQSYLHLRKFLTFPHHSTPIFLFSLHKPSSSPITSSHPAKHPSIHSSTTLFTKTVNFTITTHKFTQSLIESLEEYVRGSEMLEKGQYPLAIREFQMALKFLPKNVIKNSGGDDGTNCNDADKYRKEYDGLVKKLLEAHVMMNKPLKAFTETYKEYLTKQSPLYEFIKTLQQVEQGNFTELQSPEAPPKLWQQLIRAFAFRQSSSCFGKHIPIEKIRDTKDLALKFVGLYLYEKIKARKNKQREDIYLNTCRQLLKTTEQFQPSKIVKPLSLMASNFLSGDQFLQAQGLMSHCLSVLEQFHHQNPIYLKTNQEYIMCKLMMARVFDGVRREEESKKIKEEYEGLFDQKKLLVQELVQVGLRQL